VVVIPKKIQLNATRERSSMTINALVGVIDRPAFSFYLSDGTVGLPGLTWQNDTDSGLYLIGPNDMGMSAGGTLVTEWKKTGSDVQLLWPDGSPTVPGAAFIADPDTGVYRPGANVGALTAGGQPSAVWSAGAFKVTDGTVGVPSLGFVADPDTGVYLAGANTGGLVANGAQVATWQPGAVRVVDGLVTAPALSFISDPDTGVWSAGAGRLAVAVNGLKVGEFSNLSGSVLNFSLGPAVTPAALLHASATQTGQYIGILEQLGAAAADKGLWIKTGGTAAADAALLVQTGASPTGLVVNNDGNVFVGDNANANTTRGLTVNMGAFSSTHVLALKSASIAHGMTASAETDTFWAVLPLSANGTMLSRGYSAGGIGHYFQSFVATEDSTHTTSSFGYHYVDGALRSGAGPSTVPPTAARNMLVVASGGAAHFILDTTGVSYQDVGTLWTNFDGEDDAALLTAFSVAVSDDDDPIRTQFMDVLDRNREALDRARVVEINEDGSRFMNQLRMTMLLVGACRQVAARCDELEARLLALERCP
jgi:hypothetical protein